eukprot:12299950-Heterocapsa_arctica.AAC.1
MRPCGINLANKRQDSGVRKNGRFCHPIELRCPKCPGSSQDIGGHMRAGRFIGKRGFPGEGPPGPRVPSELAQN